MRRSFLRSVGLSAGASALTASTAPAAATDRDRDGRDDDSDGADQVSVDAWWTVIDWDDVESRSRDARDEAAERY